MAIPPLRLRAVNDCPVQPRGDYVLYWMIAFRRTRWNFALQQAVDLAREWNKPLVIFEPLRVEYPWASHRLHHFVIQGMTENQRREADVLCARDLLLRAITFFGLIAAVLLALLAIQWV